MMANTPGFEAAVRRAAQSPTLDIGLHLNLTVGPPIAPPDRVSSLLDRKQEMFVPLRVLVLRALRGQIRLEHVAAECAAQIDRLRSAGITPTHLDGHRHVHALPGFLAPVAASAFEAGIGVIRAPLEPLMTFSTRFPALLTKALVTASWFSSGTAGKADGRFRRVDHFRGISLQGGKDFEQRFLTLIERLPAGTTELMVHPGHADAELRKLDSYTDARERELAVLSAPRIADWLRLADVDLISFREL
jgi:predicted glycoside hydrolase/deacetylase ChbG (UPF0249 family)